MPSVRPSASEEQQMGHRREPPHVGRDGDSGFRASRLPAHVQRAQSVRLRHAVEERESLRELRDFFDSEFSQTDDGLDVPRAVEPGAGQRATVV
jgi:hypothetical protein